MTDSEIRALVDRYLDADYLTHILVRLLQTPTDVPLGQTELAPEDPKLARYVRDVVRPELVGCGFERIAVDDSNNLVCQIGAETASPSLLLMGYAVAQHGNLMADPHSGRIAPATCTLREAGSGSLVIPCDVDPLVVVFAITEPLLDGREP